MHGTLDEMATRPVAELLRMVRESQGYAECSPELWLTPLLYAIERKAAKLEGASPEKPLTMREEDGEFPIALMDENGNRVGSAVLR